MESMTAFVHQRILRHCYNIGVDFTMGHGNDTLFLSECCRHVYAFDIQEAAYHYTKNRLQGLNNVSLYLEDHYYFTRYVDRFDVGIFNLGYLPRSDSPITTKKETTLKTLTLALERLNVKGQLYLVVYVGHQEGKEESEALLAYVKDLSCHLYNVALFQMVNKRNAPYVIEIEKIKESISE